MRDWRKQHFPGRWQTWTLRGTPPCTPLPPPPPSPSQQHQRQQQQHHHHHLLWRGSFSGTLTAFSDSLKHFLSLWSRSWGGRRVAEQRTNSHANSMLAFFCPFVVLLHLNCWQSLLVLNRAKGLVRQMQGGQKHIFWGCGRCRILLNIFEIWGAGWVR